LRDVTEKAMLDPCLSAFYPHLLPMV
jgi:hypothetical protein